MLFLNNCESCQVLAWHGVRVYAAMTQLLREQEAIICCKVNRYYKFVSRLTPITITSQSDLLCSDYSGVKTKLLVCCFSIVSNSLVGFLCCSFMVSVFTNQSRSMAYNYLLRDRNIWRLSITGKCHYVYLPLWTLCYKENSYWTQTFVQFLFFFLIDWLAFPHKMLS